mmetsp:Transcript_8872/g.21030  ORF Transcript_8872/g.21030 Transcript_8872/m.21030 type:complete len:299 (-) Transcript_8872:582-1478(-)
MKVVQVAQVRRRSAESYAHPRGCLRLQVAVMQGQCQTLRVERITLVSPLRHGRWAETNLCNFVDADEVDLIDGYHDWRVPHCIAEAQGQDLRKVNRFGILVLLHRRLQRRILATFDSHGKGTIPVERNISNHDVTQLDGHRRHPHPLSHGPNRIGATPLPAAGPRSTHCHPIILAKATALPHTVPTAVGKRGMQRVIPRQNNEDRLPVDTQAHQQDHDDKADQQLLDDFDRRVPLQVLEAEQSSAGVFFWLLAQGELAKLLQVQTRSRRVTLHGRSYGRWRRLCELGLHRRLCFWHHC